MVSFADGDFLTGLGDSGGGLHCPTALRGHAGFTGYSATARARYFHLRENLFGEQLERWFFLRNEDKCISREILWRMELGRGDVMRR